MFDLIAGIYEVFWNRMIFAKSDVILVNCIFYIDELVDSYILKV